jgi:hypothetical protein
MLLLFPQGGGVGVTNVNVSDTLLVRVTETPVNDFFLDVPETLRISILDAAANAVDFTRTDTLSVRIVESSSITATGTTARAGTDTLSVGISDAAGVAAVLVAATDTLSVQISDSGAVTATQVPIAASDTLSLTVTEFGSINSVATVTLNSGDILDVRFEESTAITIPTRVERINFAPMKGSIRFSAL